MKKLISRILAFVFLFSSFVGVSEGKGVLELSKSSSYRFSDDRLYLIGINGIPDVSEVISNFNDSGNVFVTSPDGVQKTGSVASDDFVKNGSDQVRILIYGDVDRNGKINARDVICAMKSICDPTIDVCSLAIDVNEDGKKNSADVILLMRFIVGYDLELGNIVYPSIEFKIDASYRIVISEDADETEEEAAELLSTALDSLYQTGMGRKWVIDDSKTADKEIIVGHSNRTIANRYLNRLTSEGYFYNIIDPSTIIISGTDSEGTYEAVNQFLWDNYGYIDKYNTVNSAKVWNGSEYVDLKGSTVLTSSKSFYYQYPEDKVDLILNGLPIDEYTVVPKDEHYAQVAEIFIRNIRLLTGKTLKTNMDYSGENAFYIGRTANGGNYSSAGLIYNIGNEGSSLYIDSYRLNVTRFAVRAFSHKYLLTDHSDNVNINISENTFGAYRSNLLENISDSHREISEGIVYRELGYIDRHGLPIKAFVVEVKSGVAELKVGTPNGETSISGNLSTTTNNMRSLLNEGYNVVAGINADFFALGGTNYPLGLCIKDGQIMQESNGRPWFAVLSDGSYRIGTGYDSRKLLDQMVTAVGGSHIILKNGNLSDVSQDTDFGGIRHPRTAIGYNSNGDLYMIVVDGRHPDYSNGASLTDLALILKNLGAENALNLDGGGSSTLALVNSGSITIKNYPSDYLERAVYNSLVLIK